MPWFWGSKKQHNNDDEDEEDDDDDSYSDEEEDSYSGEEEEYSGDDEEDHSDNEHDDDSDVEEHQQQVEEQQEQEEFANIHQSPDTNGTKASGGNDNESDDANRDFESALKESEDEDTPSSPPNRHSRSTITKDITNHSVSTNGDASLIESEGLHSADEACLDTSDEEDDFHAVHHKNQEKVDSEHDDDSSADEVGAAPSSGVVKVETVNELDSDEDDDVDDFGVNGSSEQKHNQEKDENEEDEEEEVTSFWEKQSLLVLAAEHDRVDILKAILTDDDQDKVALMTSGIPPLHIAISFGSTNSTQSLLRMGADPSIRPNVARVKEEQKEAPEGTKLEIPNMARFDGVTAWELAFGNVAYQEQKGNKKSWAMFGNGSTPSVEANSMPAKVIKPVDMAPSKLEGIRHAFTAEALRCIGGDEVERLEQLLRSGMPHSIEIGGKDLYDWAVQLGGLKCEELLRPKEAAKHGSSEGQTTSEENTNDQQTDASAPAPEASGKVLDRATPGGKVTISHLINRLDELESLASALSKCLDNLAEEVSVCHGLLLMGGGAAALASHVKSLKTLKEQKENQLEAAHAEWELAEQELKDLVRSSGEIGAEVVKLVPSTFVGPEFSRTESFLVASTDESNDDDDFKRQQLLAQIAASESKILKLRASIADLSEENAREIEAVEKRGLSGGITLVRGLRDELREIDYQLNEAKSMNATCRTKIGMIHSRLPTKPRSMAPPATPALPTASVKKAQPGTKPTNVPDVEDEHDESGTDLEENAESATHTNDPVASALNGETPGGKDTSKSTMDVIASGDSQALVLRSSGNRGYFTLDLWQVLLRIIGFDSAATRRGVQMAQKKKNLMIV